MSSGQPVQNPVMPNILTQSVSLFPQKIFVAPGQVHFIASFFHNFETDSRLCEKRKVALGDAGALSIF